ncbi:hypothetical protein PybrP1_009958 [[Pythium] brassicae (nom. inval.)]|nr:hypothetical protein PybrP1_009958 [[Pythium] brassicae (nom. inval.)]
MVASSPPCATSQADPADAHAHDTMEEPSPLPASLAARPQHALARSRNRAHTSPHLDVAAPVALLPESESFALRRRRREAAGMALARVAIGRLLHTRKAASFSEGVEPATAARLADTDVFLGGSCNPTTWRREVALPLLEAAHVKYFNPQVEDWYEELIPLETRAKETAKVVLMVIDNSTRSMVGINEAVEYICRGRRVVLVVDDLAPGATVEGAALSPEELADLNGARECLRHLAAKKGVRVFGSVADAVMGTIAWVREDNLTTFVPQQPRLRKRASIVLNKWSGQIRPGRATSRSASSTAMLSLTAPPPPSAKGSGAGPSRANSSPPPGSESPIVHNLGAKLYGSYKGGSVYLGGNVDATSWRERVAVPLLRKAGIPFFVPLLDYVTFNAPAAGKPAAGHRADWWKELDAAKDNAELILFVIPRQARSIAAMTEAVELVASWHAMLLVIEPLEDGCIATADGRAVGGREFKDLARARAYLREMAERNDVQVFASVEDAVECIVESL